MRPILLRVLIAALGLSTPSSALAQPELWTVEWPVDLFLSLPRGVYAIDAATGQPRARIDSDAVICLGEGGISADRRSYFVPVRLQGLGDGVVRIDTSTKQIVQFTPVPGLAMASSCSFWTLSGISHPRARLFTSASNRWWHLNAVMNGGRVHQIIDALTGAILASKTFEPAVVEMRFDVGGFQRFERTSGETDESPPVLTAFADGSFTPRWSVSSEYLAAFDVGPDGVFVLDRASGGWRLRRLEPTTGDELAGVTVPLDFIGRPRIHYSGGRVLLVGAVAGAFCRGGLMWFDAATLALGNSNTPDICDASLWRYRDTLDVFVDRETGIGYWHQELIVVEFSPGVQLFDAATLTLGARRLGPGGSPAEDRRPGRVRFTELATPGSRVQVTWHPDAAAGVPESYEVWAGRRGEALTRAAVLDASARTWQSPPGPPGSYAIEVIARNLVGASVAARVDVNIADASIPHAPTNLIAAMGDTAVRLSWHAPTSGPAPSQYVIEAAPAGSGNFVVVAQSSLPEYFVATAPIGTWNVRVRAATSGGISAPSNVVTVAPRACSAPPGAPTSTVSLVSGNSLTVQWQLPADNNAAEYVIEVGSRSGVADLARVVVAASATTFQTAAPDGVYAIRVRARNAC
jgi:hypothetical protein